MESMKPEKAQEILRDAGLEVSLDKAKAILKFLELIAEISIEVYLNGGDTASTNI